MERFIELALADHIKAYRLAGAAAFFTSGLDTYRGALQRAEQALLAARTQGAAVWSATEQRSLLLRTQSDQRLQHQQAVTLAAEIDAEVAAAETTLAGLPAEVEISSVRARNRAIDELRSRLVQLRVDQGGQRARYGDTSPEVVELDRQIGTLTAALAGEPEYRVGEVTAGVNPAHQFLGRDLTTKRILREGQRAKVEQLAREIEHLTGELTRLSAAAIEIEQMELDTARLRRLVELYAKGLDDARIAEAMEAAQLSGLRVIMPPTAEIIPSSPSIRRGVLLGLVAGLILSGAMIALLEYRRRSKMPDDTDAATASTEAAPPAAS